MPVQSNFGPALDISSQDVIGTVLIVRVSLPSEFLGIAISEIPQLAG